MTASYPRWLLLPAPWSESLLDELGGDGRPLLHSTILGEYWA